tara:strand:- start:1403 stop:5332 length:3930 start_codon:yes stop_codon:yes gene_type:complete
VPKKLWKIEAFEGGINQKADPRDIKDNQLEEAFNVDVSNPGRIVMTGDGTYDYNLFNAKRETVTPNVNNSILNNPMNLTPGYGLFAFSHDYNMLGVDASDGSATPLGLGTDFLCINDGADIHIWDSCHSNGTDAWLSKAITLGKAHASGDFSDVDFIEKVKPVYYKADNGLRVCDGQFCRQDTGALTNDADFTSSHSSFTSDEITLTAGEYIKINNEIMQVVSDVESNTTVTVKRGQFGTTASSHADDSIIYTINVPKVLSHINRPMLEKARIYSSSTAYTYGTAENINIWKESAQSLEPPDNYGTYGLSVYDGQVSANAVNGLVNTPGGSAHDDTDDVQLLLEPNQKEKVHYSVWESHSEDDKVFAIEEVTDGGVVNTNNCVTLVATDTGINFAGEGYTVGKIIIISGSTNYDGVAEIIAMGDASHKITVAMQFADDASDTEFEVRLEENRIDENLQNKYIFGMSYTYDGGGSEIQESPIKPGYVYSGLISHDESIGKAGGNLTTAGWLVSADLETINTALPTSSGDHWRHFNNYIWFDDSAISGANEFLVYRMSSSQAAGNYKISIDVTISNSATLIIHPPFFNKTSTDASGGTIGDGTSDGTSVTIDKSGTYFFHAKGCDADSPVMTDIFVAEGVNSASSDNDIRINSVQVFKETPVEMDANNAIDMRGWEGIPKTFSSFNLSKNDTYKWNERINGYRIYMKQVDSATTSLSNEWLLLKHVDLEKGIYINYGNDNVEKELHAGNSYDRSTDGDSFAKSLVTTSKVAGDNKGAIEGDTLRNIPLDTYESENGYKAETNTAAMYKTATVVDRKVFIGNLKVGDKTYPDRMIEAPTDRFDTFPDDGLHYIDVAVGDGDEIVKLESVGNKLIQFKKKHAYLIEVSSEGVDLLDTWPYKGIKSPCQAIPAGDGIVWANNNGLYYYNGKELQAVTGENFSAGTWVVEEDETKPIILGYDEASNKVLILTTNVTGKDNGGYIYDIQNSSLTECQNLFTSYPTQFSHILTDVNGDGNIDIQDIIYLGTNGPEGTNLEGLDMTSVLPAFMDNIIDGNYQPMTPDSLYRTNMIPTRDRHIIMGTNTSTIDNKVNITAWKDTPSNLYNWNSSAVNFNVQTKDIDFGNISRRKKVYSIYVSFKAQSKVSGVRVKYATNGSNDFSGTFKDTTYYSNAKGFDAYNGGTSSDDWITVQLKPTTSIRNLYSIQLQFSFASAGRINALASGGVATAPTIILDSGASATDDYYNGMPIYFYNGPGSGQIYGAKITDYLGINKRATLSTALTEAVTTSTNFDIGFIPAEFAINDISIVYRQKSIK